MRRTGFTLVEMLVVLVIIITLTALAVGAMRKNDADRLNTAASQAQQRIMLAASTAQSDRAIRGVRLERDPNDPRVCRSISMIGSAGYKSGLLDDIRVIPGNPSTTGDDYWQISGEFNNLAIRNLIQVGTHIEIPNGSGTWYTLSDRNFDPANGNLSIAGQYSPSKWDGTLGHYVVNHQWTFSGGLSEDIGYRIELAPNVTSDAPLALPVGTCIELDASQVPNEWRVPGSNCDILFNVNGGTDGEIGLIHLYVTRLADVELTRNIFPNHPANGGTQGIPIVPANSPSVPAEQPYIITVLKNTGTCYVSQVDQTDSDSDLQADNPYVIARRGVVSK